MAFKKMNTKTFKRRVQQLVTGVKGPKTVQTFSKAGVPTADTDLAVANGDQCVDLTNDDLYVASVVAPTTTTWTKLT